MLKNYLLFGLALLSVGVSLEAFAAKDEFSSAVKKVEELKDEFDLPSLSVAIGLDNQAWFQVLSAILLYCKQIILQPHK